MKVTFIALKLKKHKHFNHILLFKGHAVGSRSHITVCVLRKYSAFSHEQGAVSGVGCS